MKILYVTDLHGSRWKYDRLFEAAQAHQVEAVINGGDMLPKSGDLFAQDTFITGQLDQHFAQLGNTICIQPGQLNPFTYVTIDLLSMNFERHTEAH